MSEFEKMRSQMRREHPWIMRRARWRAARQGFIGKHFRWLCRHTTSTGPAGGDIGWCLHCGKELDWTEDRDA